ncbi:aryl-sulfate sulfotransferase [Flagellimonas oceanensis]|uniref:aryl-sulfate sulfotransferase n=1 Tax=Flagellimonas oceanensis TaxID=2499163 RepID=UPI003BA95B33
MRNYLSQILSLFAAMIVIACNNDNAPEEIYHTLRITSDQGGTVDVASGKYLEGTSLTITAYALEGFEFSGWSGDLNSETTTLAISIDQALEIHANFNEVENSLNENVLELDEELVDTSGYIFAIESGQNTCYLLDHSGNKIYNWEFDANLGQDIEITPDGNLLGLFQVESPQIGFGGQSGLVRMLDKEGTLIWEYVLASENEIAHHDLTQLPNGNILVLVWERISNEEATAVGLNNTTDIFTEKIVEIDPITDSIVWEWRSWEHIVQNYNENLASYGDPDTLKNKINILYANNSVHQFVEDGDIMHANGLDYLPEKDIIALSINFFSEVWIIDHSTTTEEAKTGSGGQFGRGGDLLYRFGNQRVFGNMNATNIFDFNHHPTFVKNQGSTSLLIYNNNQMAQRSSAMEFSLPEINGLTLIGSDPNLIFEFTDDALYHPRISGAYRLPNGNTLICEGDFGYWEVTPQGKVVWKYQGEGTSFWRGIFYSKQSPQITNLELD